MSFAQPAWLVMLLLVLPLALWARRGERRRLRGWEALGSPGPRPSSTGTWPLLGAIACLAAALSGPRWGTRPAPPLPPSQDVVLLVDASRSMAAADAVPDRLGLAIEAGEALLTALGTEPGTRVAVVAFAGRGVPRCPLTENLGAAYDALRALQPGSIRPGGTDLGAALDAAIDAFDDREPAEGRSIIVLSDGEDLAGTGTERIEALKSAGVVVHAVTIGDDSRGHPIPLDASPGGPRRSLSFQGETVQTRRQDEPLGAIARATGGSLLRLGLSRPAALAALYRERIAPRAAARRRTTRQLERVDRSATFALAAVGLILWGRWPRQSVLAALLAGLTLGADRPVTFTPAEPLSAPHIMSRGMGHYRSGRFDAALNDFEAAATAVPSSPIPVYNAAATLYQLGRFDEAETRYRQALALAEDDPALTLKIHYALGHVAAAQGRADAAIAMFDRCLSDRLPGAVADAIRRDAAHNREAVERARAARRAAPPPRPDEPHRSQDAPPRPDGRDPRPPDRQADASVRPTPRGSPTVAPFEGDTPEEQLRRAVNQVRRNARRRLDPVEKSTFDETMKDW